MIDPLKLKDDPNAPLTSPLTPFESHSMSLQLLEENSKTISAKFHEDRTRIQADRKLDKDERMRQLDAAWDEYQAGFVPAQSEIKRIRKEEVEKRIAELETELASAGDKETFVRIKNDLLRNRYVGQTINGIPIESADDKALCEAWRVGNLVEYDKLMADAFANR